jgi:hypothetical protein
MGNTRYHIIELLDVPTILIPLVFPAVLAVGLRSPIIRRKTERCPSVGSTNSDLRLSPRGDVSGGSKFSRVEGRRGGRGVRFLERTGSRRSSGEVFLALKSLQLLSRSDFLWRGRTHGRRLPPLLLSSLTCRPLPLLLSCHLPIRFLVL